MLQHILALPLACSRCGKHCKSSGCGTGYGITEKGERHCYQCCAETDRAYMVEHGKYSDLYLTKRHNAKPGESPWHVTNWPGTLSFPVWHVRESWHNFAGHNGRRDAWFNGPDGHVWHVVSIGWGENCRASRSKETWRKTEAA